MDKQIRVALSGATGNLGRILRKRLAGKDYHLRCAGGRTPMEPSYPGEDVMHGDLRERDVVDRLLEGRDVLVHMAGTSVERPLEEIIQNNLIGLREIYEGARRHRVRVIFASSNHAFGMHGVDDKLTEASKYRPDGFYGLSKMWGEGMARMYWDKHGVESVCLRIGSGSDQPPSNRRQLSTWLGEDDLVQLVCRAIEAPSTGYAEIWGISDNTRAFYDLSTTNPIGYAPRLNAEDWAAAAQDILPHPDPVASEFQGGAFVVDDYTPPAARRLSAWHASLAPARAGKDQG